MTAAHHKRADAALRREWDVQGPPCVGPPGDPTAEGFRRRSFSTFHPFGQPKASPNKSVRLRWSADFSGGGASTVVVVRKSKARPEPPLRGVSLPLRSHSSACCPSKRHSCPPSPRPAPPVQTSVLTGPSPLGCRPPPVSRLSLQIPPSLCVPDPPRRAPPGPRKPRRCHSDGSAPLRCSAGGPPLHLVTPEELGAVRLRPAGQPVPDGSDDVFAAEENRKEQDLKTAPPQSPKVPPLVPAKSAYSKWLAQRAARSESAVTRAEPVYTRVKKISEAGSPAGPGGPPSALPGYQ